MRKISAAIVLLMGAILLPVMWEAGPHTQGPTGGCKACIQLRGEPIPLSRTAGNQHKEVHPCTGDFCSPVAEAHQHKEV